MPGKVPEGETRGWIVPIGGAENKENDRHILARFVDCSGTRAIARTPTSRSWRPRRPSSGRTSSSSRRSRATSAAARWARCRASCALEWARPGDVLVLLVHSLAARKAVLGLLQQRCGR
jgi:hypothetical protein